jgi:hypothetical protein
MTTKEFIHYSPKPFVLDWHFKGYTKDSIKPHGLWLSDGEGWKNLCIDNEFMLGDIAYSSVINVDMTDIFEVGSGMKATDLQQKYPNLRLDGSSRFIDWPSVKRDFKGVYLSIYPFQWSTNAFYGWDVESCCVWDLTAIKSVDTDPCQKPFIPEVQNGTANF